MVTSARGRPRDHRLTCHEARWVVVGIASSTWRPRSEGGQPRHQSRRVGTPAPVEVQEDRPDPVSKWWSGRQHVHPLSRPGRGDCPGAGDARPALPGQTSHGQRDGSSEEKRGITAHPGADLDCRIRSRVRAQGASRRIQRPTPVYGNRVLRMRDARPPPMRTRRADERSFAHLYDTVGTAHPCAGPEAPRP